MGPIQPGDIWFVMVAKQKRKAKVIGPARRCRDVETGIEFLPRQGWLVERISSGDN